MLYGIAHVSIASLSSEPNDSSELLSQVLYGETFKIIEKRKFWSKARLDDDSSEGWINNLHYQPLDEAEREDLLNLPQFLSSDLVEFVEEKDGELLTIALGSSVRSIDYFGSVFDGNYVSGKQSKNQLIPTAYNYRNAPFLWGGKTPFGIDAGGFTQMVYKLNGYKLPRAVDQQARQGEALSFIEESEPGDLAFFDDQDGTIVHVGIIMADNYIIHAYGKVRIDRLDHSGIYNTDLKRHTHKLRVIKKII